MAAATTNAAITRLIFFSPFVLPAAETAGTLLPLRKIAISA